jgi:urease alpha subunit
MASRDGSWCAKKARFPNEAPGRLNAVVVNVAGGGITQAPMILNRLTPKVEVDLENYMVKADGEILVCEPAKELPMAQRNFMY